MDQSRIVFVLSLVCLICVYPVCGAELSVDYYMKSHILDDIVGYMHGTVSKKHIVNEIFRYIYKDSKIDRPKVGSFISNYDFDHNGRITYHDYQRIAKDYLHGNITVAQLNTIKWILNEYDGYIFMAAKEKVCYSGRCYEIIDRKLLDYYIHNVPPAFGKVVYIDIYVNDTFAMKLETKHVDTKKYVGYNVLEVVDFSPNIVDKKPPYVIKIPEGATLTVKGKMTYLDGTPIPEHLVEGWWDFSMSKIKHSDITYEQVENGNFEITIPSKYFEWKVLEKYKFAGCSDVLGNCWHMEKREKPLKLCNRTIHNYMCIHATHFSGGMYSFENSPITAELSMGDYIKRYKLKPPKLYFHVVIHPYAVCE